MNPIGLFPFIIPILYYYYCLLCQASETLKGLIHNDIHPGNIVLTQADSKGEFEINGIIDFWDCLHGPYLFELGIAIAGHMFNRKDPIAYVKPFLQGYLAVLCLAQSSLDVLYYVVLGRLAQLYINSKLMFFMLVHFVYLY